MNKSACVPKLRFPQFQNAAPWEEKTLGEVAERIIEKVGKKQLITLSISSGIGFVSQAEKFSRDISGNQYENYICLRKGDFSYNKGNSKKFPQGCIYELEKYQEAAVPNAFISFHFRESYVPCFYKGYFDNNFHGKQLTKFITSGARMDGLLNISPLDFFSIILPTPIEKDEQQKIADCLTSLDNLITAEDKKLTTYKTHKKGLMQQLFPKENETVPKLRFEEFRGCGKWEEKKLGEVADYKNGGSFEKSIVDYGKYYLITLNSIDIDGNLKNNHKQVNEADWFLIKNDLVIVLSDVAHGNFLGLCDLIPIDNKYILNQRMALLRVHSNLNVQFIRFFINHNQKYFKFHGQGSSQKNLSKDSVLNLIINIPKLPEQQKIADCLSSLDNLITAQSKKIEQLKQHKKGLMQGLFCLKGDL